MTNQMHSTRRLLTFTEFLARSGDVSPKVAAPKPPDTVKGPVGGVQSFLAFMRGSETHR